MCPVGFKNGRPGGLGARNTAASQGFESALDLSISANRERGHTTKRYTYVTPKTQVPTQPDPACRQRCDCYGAVMRRITLRVPDEVHDQAASAAQAQGQSLNSFATVALLAQVGERSYSEWRQLVEDSHRASNYRGLSPDVLEEHRTLTGKEDS